MADFMIRFLICNLFIAILIGIFLAAKCLFKHTLTGRMHYTLWYALLGLLLIPFLPALPIASLQIFSSFQNLRGTSLSPVETILDKAAVPNRSNAANWMNDFGISVSRQTPSPVGLILCILWGIGVFVMTALLLKSTLRFHTIKKSALPLQNCAVRRLYRGCLHEMHIARPVPIYSTAFLKSPVIAGLFRPSIYVPIHLISDYSANAMRYMLLHELAHHKHRDTLAGCVMNIVGILYWFNPSVWYALKEMKNDREIACDTSVLELLGKEAREDYGKTLIQFAEKVSIMPFPFAAGMGGNMKQMKKRITNIANYEPASFGKILRSALVSIMIALFLLGSAPILSIQAEDNSRYYFHETDKNITYIDLSDVFGQYDGSFVLYDAAEGSWQIYNKEYAFTRISPASTFKLYSALFGLESGTITPEQSLLPWNGRTYEFDLWNADQTLQSAMQNSVTWYFQALDRKTGLASIEDSVREIGYGNRLVEGSVSSYWMNSSLKISPIEQVEMLENLYYNRFGFSPENIEAVKNSIRLSSTDYGDIYGKTGTEQVNGQNVSGWFIGYVEKDGRPYFFAANIQSENLASGPIAAELTFSVLSRFDLWKTGTSQYA